MATFRNRSINTKVIFIAGASRSGSTLVEDRITRAGNGVNSGEMYSVNKFFNENWDGIYDSASRLGCACGVAVKECKFWSDVAQKADLSLGDDIFSTPNGWITRSLFKISVLFLGSFLTRKISYLLPAFRQELKAGNNCWKLYDAMTELTGAPYVVDSSKQLHQYLMLRSVRPHSVFLLSLLRDGRAVSLSMIKGDRKKRFVRKIESERGPDAVTDSAIIGSAANAWLKSMLYATGVYLMTPRRRRGFLRYEVFCVRPDDEIHRVFNAFGFQEGPRPALCENHAIGGSPSRHDPNKREIHLDEGWRESWGVEKRTTLPVGMRVVNWLVGYRR